MNLPALLMLTSLFAVIMLPARPALAYANIVMNSTSQESVTFALYNTTTTGGTIQWSNGSSGMLLDTGNPSFPKLGKVNGTSQNFSTTNVATFSNSLSANQNPPFTVPLPASFGSATVTVAGNTNVGTNAGTDVNTQPGVSFNAGTKLQSASTLTPGTAAVSYSALHADFTNSSSGLGAGTFSGLSFGAEISASGFLSHTAGSFVELANSGTVTINGVANPFAVIVAFAYSGTGTNLTQQTFTYVAPLPKTASSSLTFTAPNPTSGDFTVTNLNVNFGQFSVPKGATFSVDSQLTLVSDPGSLIQLADVPNPGPHWIGSLAGSVVPEPSAWIQLGTAMVLLGTFWFRGKSRSRGGCPHSSKSRNASLATLAGLTILILGAGVETTEAGTIMVNDLQSPPVSSSGGFSTTSISLDGAHQVVTFDGTYLSSGGFPAPGQAATYSVVFQEPDSAQRAISTLTITGLTPTASANTRVQLDFMGLVTTAISPGPGVFFIPEPAGYFDVAAYLVRQGAPDVPGDLSVLIETTAVPEPASLAMSSIGLLAGLWIMNQRRRQG